MQKEVDKLRERRTKDNEYITKAMPLDKDDAIQKMKEKYDADIVLKEELRDMQ